MHYRNSALLIFLAASTSASAQECHRGAYSTICAPARTIPTGPAQPSPEQQQRQREAQDEQEAADDAQDRGIAAYRRGDYAAAVRLFEEASRYAPDDPDIAQNLNRSRQHLNDLASRQAVAAAQLGRSSERVFDGSGPVADAGGIFGSSGPTVSGVPVRDPVVPTSRRTPAITSFEQQRTQERQRIAAIEAEIRSLDPNRDSVRIAQRRQARAAAESQVNYLNFSISEALRVPPAAADRR